MKTYADTSFLFSLYAADANSIRADAWRQANPAPLSFTAFHRLESRNALSLPCSSSGSPSRRFKPPGRKWRTIAPPVSW